MNFDLLFKKAKEKGIEDIQVYLDSEDELSINVLKNAIDKYQISSSSKLLVKGIYDSKMGNVSTELINDEEIDFIVDSIVASANAVESEDEVFIYEGDKEYRKVEGLYNDKFNEVLASKKIDDMLKFEKIVLAKDERIQMVQIYYQDGKKEVVIENSKGLKLNKLINFAFAGAYVIASDGKDQRVAFEYAISNDYDSFDFEELASEGARRAVALLGATPCKSGAYEILLTNRASTSLLAPHVGMFSAESVQRGISLLKGKVGEKIGSSLVTLVDDPFMKNSFRSGAFDDEGVATTYKEVIKNGELTGLLYNLKTAKKDSTKSTGNGFINGISPSNFYFLPGETQYDDAVKSMKKGLIITSLDGTHSGADPISGDFSLQASGFLVEDGKIVKPVALITVAGNYLTLLQDVTEVCSDLKFDMGNNGSPSMKIKSLVVSGT